MPKKQAGGPKKKTASARKTTGAAKKTATKKTAGKPAAPPARSYTPLYVAIIMVLLIVILFLVNRQIGERGIIGQLDRGKKTETKDARPAASADNSGKEQAARSDDGSRTADPGAPVAEKRAIKLFLYAFNEKTEKLTLTTVGRSIETREPVRDAIRELAKGPSAREERQGLLSAVPKNLRVNSVRVANGTAVIDVNGAIEENANGSILLNRIDQIVYTATQFDGVKAVEITVNGKKRRFLGGDGLSVGGALRRHR